MWIDEMNYGLELTDKRDGSKFRLAGNGMSHLPVTWEARHDELQLLYAQEQ